MHPHIEQFFRFEAGEGKVLSTPARLPQQTAEDEAIATGVEARFDELLATSRRIDEDPDWRHRADLRRWMRYWPGLLSG